MTAREVSAGDRAVSSVVGILQELGNNYFASAAARREFPSQVVLLQERHSTLAAQLKKYNEDVGPALVEAKKLMLKVVKTLEKRRSREQTDGCSTLCGIASVATQRVAETAFPKKIGIAVTDAIRAYERIEVLLKTRRENEEHIRSLASNSPIPLPFCDDNLYVSLKGTESRLSNVINQPEGEVTRPRVVLLYGGPGTGKSTVSRHISLEYESNFDHVVWLECGFSPDPISVQLKLLQSLGWSNDSEITEESSNQWLLRGTMQSRLKNALKTQKVLIVLDDLHHPQLLQDFLILSEPNVTYLVTSQREDICDNLSCSFRFKIQIENVGVNGPNSKNISRKMLAVHSGYEDGNIPPHLQDVADKIVDQAGGIPLVIATFGAQLKNADHRDDPAVWKCLLGSPAQVLDEGMPSQNIHGVPYPKSYWLVLSHSVNSLGDEEKQMLLLLGTCKDASAPEGVVFFLLSSVCTKRKSDILHFLTTTKKLKSRQLASSRIQYHLHLHSLTKIFIREKMEELAKNLTKAVADSIVDKTSTVLAQQAPSSSSSVTKAAVSHVVVRFYLDEDIVHDMLSSIAFHMSQPNVTFSDAKKTTIESITLKLLALDANWTEEVHQAASQVFLDFVYKDFLCNAHLSLLLRCPTWVTPTLKFLRSACALGESFWKKSTDHGFLSTFENILGAEHHPHIQVQATDALERLVYYEGNCRHILNAANMLHQLVNNLCQSQNSAVQSSSAQFLLSCSSSAKSHLCHEKLLEQVLMHILPGLLNLLAMDHNVHIHRQAVDVLASFVSSSDLKRHRQILSYPTLLPSLVALLVNQSDPTLQECAARAIGRLVSANPDQAMRQKIAAYPGLLDNLETRLDEGYDLDLRLSAARALINLSWTKDIPKCLGILALSLEMDEDPLLQQTAVGSLFCAVRFGQMMVDQISSYPGLLEKVVKLLDNNVNTDIRIEAAGFLIQLSDAEQTSTKFRVLTCPLLLDKVVTCLRNRQDSVLQRRAAWIIGNLTGEGADRAIRDHVINFSGLLNILENILDEADDPKLCGDAARTLVNLTPTKNTTKLLKVLARSLEPGQSHPVRIGAAEGIGDLAQEGDVVRHQILEFPGLLCNLVESLDHQIEYHYLHQRYVARALSKMSASQSIPFKLNLSQTPLLLERVVALVGTTEDPGLSSNAVSIVVNLASAHAETGQETVESARWMDELEKLLNHENAFVQDKAVTTCLNLQQQLDGVSQPQPTELQSSSWWQRWPTLRTYFGSPS